MFQMDESSLPRVVIVGDYGAGKSSFIRVLTGQSAEEGGEHSTDEQMPPMVLTVEDREEQSISQLCIIDTLAADLEGTAARMGFADLVIIVFKASNPDWRNILIHGWMPRLRDASVRVPCMICVTQIDRLTEEELDDIKDELNRLSLTNELFIVDSVVCLSAMTGHGLDDTRRGIVRCLDRYAECPQWTLIDPWTQRLKKDFTAAIHRIFRLLDADCDGILDFESMRILNCDILDEDFTEPNFGKLLKRLKETDNNYVVPGLGVTLAGLTFIFDSLVKTKRWSQVWKPLRHFYYQNDLTLHPRIFPEVSVILPSLMEDQTIELTDIAYEMLVAIFDLYSETVNIFMADGGSSGGGGSSAADHSGGSPLSTDSSGHSNNSSSSSDGMNNTTNRAPQMRHHTHNQTLIGRIEGFQGGADMLPESSEHNQSHNNMYEIPVLTRSKLKSILSVLPRSKESLHCSLLDEDVMAHFETIGTFCDKLTLNGWLSFWAMLSVESPLRCAMQLTYLDSNDVNDSESRNSWFRVTRPKSLDKLEEAPVLDRRVLRVLLFGGRRCGKTVLSDRLISRVPRYGPSSSTTHQNSTEVTKQHRSVANRMSQTEEGYMFMAVTEVPASAEMVRHAIEHYLCHYDMIILLFDLSHSRSFYELHQILDAMPKGHRLPVQVIGTKADLKHVNQYNQDDNDEIYDIQRCLMDWGLKPYIEASITPDVSQNQFDFDETINTLCYIALNPFYGRISLKESDFPLGFSYGSGGNNPGSEGTTLRTVAKRALTLSVAFSILAYSSYKVYSYYNSQSSYKRSKSSQSRRKPLALR